MTQGSSGPSDESSRPEDEVTLPPEAMAAIAAPGGGRVVIVTGAGCSKETPTSLPLSSELAARCFRELRDDGVISSCADETDLSAVAEAVYDARAQQRELIERFPPDDFRRAEPNEGHLIAAALLGEGAMSSILTLNFDLAHDNALAMLGIGAAVSTVAGPEEHHRLGQRNLIYLHRSITCDPESLILRRHAFEDAWRDHWEEVVTQRVVSSPLTIFVGLGTPAAALVESTRKILTSIPAGSTVLVVDIIPEDQSRFFHELDRDGVQYIRGGWTELMRVLGQRLLRAHVAALEQACTSLSAEHGWAQEDVRSITERLTALGILRFGRLRARWLFRESAYALQPDDEVLRMLADLLLALALVERVAGMAARIDDEGFAEFEREGYRAVVVVCSGGGSARWALAEAKVEQRVQELADRGRRPQVVVISGVVGDRSRIAAPRDVARESAPASLVRGGFEYVTVTPDDLRARPDLVHSLVG